MYKRHDELFSPKNLHRHRGEEKKRAVNTSFGWLEYGRNRYDDSDLFSFMNYSYQNIYSKKSEFRQLIWGD